MYAAFDRFPSCKGAAVHIDRFARALFDFAGSGLLYVVGDDDLPARQIEGAVEIVRFSPRIDNFLERTVAFAERLDALLDASAVSIEIAHYRDPWSGVPIVARPHSYRTIFEVNALPSIELQHAFSVAPGTIAKIEALEDFVLQGSDDIVVPARVIRDHLMQRGVEGSKITVIPNGADMHPPAPRPAGAPDRYLLYIGALQQWQGIETLLRAFARLRDLESLHLVICSSQQPKYAKEFVKLAERLELQRIVWQFQLPTEILQGWLQHAMASLAPLTDCARNVAQGCSPLKILESMAAGLPVIATPVGAIPDVMTHGIHGFIVPPRDGKSIAAALVRLAGDREQLSWMSRACRKRVRAAYSIERLAEHLRLHYDALAGGMSLASAGLAPLPAARAARPPHLATAFSAASRKE